MRNESRSANRSMFYPLAVSVKYGDGASVSRGGNPFVRLQHLISLTNLEDPAYYNCRVLGKLTETSASKCWLISCLASYTYMKRRSTMFFIDWLCASVTIPIPNTSTNHKTNQLDYFYEFCPLRTLSFHPTRKITMGYFAVGGIVVMLLVELVVNFHQLTRACLLYTSPSPRDKRQSRMPSSA